MTCPSPNPDSDLVERLVQPGKRKFRPCETLHCVGKKLPRPRFGTGKTGGSEPRKLVYRLSGRNAY